MQRIAEMLPEVYRKLAREAADEQALLLGLWPVVVGAKIAARTRPLRLSGSTLEVQTADQQWRKELARMIPDIIRRLNAASGKSVVQDLQFLVDVKRAPRPPRRAASATGLKRDEADGIADPELRRLYRLSRRRAQAK